MSSIQSLRGHRVSLGRVAAAALTFVVASVASAQPDCGITELPSVPQGPGDPCAVPNFVSQCWKYVQQGTYSTNNSAGFALNIMLNKAPIQGDFMPLYLDPERNSMPLLPAPTASMPQAPGAFPRPTINDSIDLITGQPLLQYRDLELPFGGATFRLNRTFAHYNEWPAQPPSGSFSPGGSFEYGHSWDWAGLGWMVGEAPILLVDHSGADIIGDSANSLRCYFIPDAHHAIPFDLLEDTPEGRYEAPPRFGASLHQIGGQWNPAARDWTTPPTHYTVHLYGGAVKYTFKVYREDVPSNFLGSPVVSLHVRPPTQPDHNPLSGLQPGMGAGIPYYGLLETIEDTLSGRATLVEAAFSHQRATVYNISVGGAQTFQVGADGILVHNCAMRGRWSPTHEEAALFRNWIGVTADDARRAGAPPAGMTAELMKNYANNIRQSLSKIQPGHSGWDRASARLAKLEEYLRGAE